MAITYTQLKTAITDYTENDSTEFSDNFDRIIRNVETSIYRKADLNVFRKTSTTSLTVGDRFLAKPLDFVIDRYFKITVSGSEVDLIAKDVSFLQTFHPVPTTKGTPRYYAEWDHDTFIMAPTPDTAHVVTLGFTYRPTSIVDSGSTSWLGDNAQDVLLYGCLVESYGFNKLTENVSDMAFWQEQYKDSLASLKDEEERRQRREAYRYGEFKG